MRKTFLWLPLWLVALLATSSLAGNEPRIVRVEEDWEVIVQSPDPLLEAPQIGTWMSPQADLKDLYFGVELNHASQSALEGGGYQTKCMRGATLLTARHNCKGQRLQVHDEKIEWTQTLHLDGNDLVFEIRNGRSSTWGNFGGDDSQVRHRTDLNRLNLYSPTLSSKQSGISYASNRVAEMRLKSIRLVDDQDNVHTIEMDEIIYPEATVE
jgi:hypothetical protein